MKNKSSRKAMENRIGKGRRKRTPEFMKLGDKVYPLNRLARKIILKDKTL